MRDSAGTDVSTLDDMEARLSETSGLDSTKISEIQAEMDEMMARTSDVTGNVDNRIDKYVGGWRIAHLYDTADDLSQDLQDDIAELKDEIAMLERVQELIEE